MEKLDLGSEKIGKLILSFSVPCIISMLINSIYNIVDQIFIGKGVGSLGNAATNVIFPLVIICNAVAGLIGNGASAYLSLLLGQDRKKEAKKCIGSSVTLLFISSILISLFSFIFLDKLVYLFGCTDNVYKYAIEYGKIILIGAPFMIIYTGLASIIRSDGSPKYSMICLLSGAIVNLILDPVFIFLLNMGVVGGALATILGQILSFIIAFVYIFKMKSFKLELEDFKIDKSIFKVLGYGISSFVIQMTVLALFITMNNVMTKYGASSKYGADIPLSVYGVVSKLNTLYISFVLGLAIGAQPILGFNYGASKYDRVKETIKKILFYAFIIGIIFNLMLQIFPKQLINLFATSSDANYDLFIEFGIKCCRIFLMVCFLNVFEMSCSIIFQSLGSVKKASFTSFLRQIILFIPLCLILSSKFGLMGALYAGPIADIICFIIMIFLFKGEYKRIGSIDKHTNSIENNIKNTSNINKVITISREYGSGGRYVASLLAERLNIKFYDKELIKMASDESGLSSDYIENVEQIKTNIGGSFYNNDDKLFEIESNIIKKISKESCVIVGRCADYILKDKKNVVKIFLYSDEANKEKRVVKYYKINPNEAKKEINKINKLREKHYKYYTDRNWKDFNNYDLILNVDSLGIEKTVDVIVEYLEKY